MPLNLTKIAFDCADVGELRGRLEEQAGENGSGEARITTRYLPKREAELAGGSLYWIHGHMLVGRSPILGFEQKPDGKWWIRLAPRLIPVVPQPRRAHQGWRYLEEKDAPPDLDGEGSAEGDTLPAHLVRELARLGLA